VGGALLWTLLFVGAGYFFGNLPFVQHNFTFVVLAIVAVSVLPIVFELLAARREAAAAAAKKDQAPPEDASPGQTPWRVAPPPA
jgi:membrane-associated protein